MLVSEEIMRAFASGATILTANVRTARWLQREYGLEQRRAGRRAWATPAIEDWDTWLRRQWQEQALADPGAPLLLTSLQERRVWTRMQREDAALLVSPVGMAALAEEAYALLSKYEAYNERNHAWGRTDAERFRQWAAGFDQECARRNWLPQAVLESRVAASLNPETLPKEVLLLGFDRTTPAQERLLHVLRDCGVNARFAEMGSLDRRTEFFCAPGQHEEIAACAWWARSMIDKNPDARIGILVPDLGALRSKIERVFRCVLASQSNDIFAEQLIPFEFSLGQPLAHAPVVRAGLLLLRWLHGPLREEEVSWLLLSEFVSPRNEDYLAIAKLDAQQRDSGSLSLEITLHEFLKHSEKHHLPLLKKLQNTLKVAEANQLLKEERLAGRWVDLAQLLLREAGWPGVAERDTLHFQALRRWERALDEIALLDFDGQRVDYGGFLRTLEAHAQETIFSPESHGAPVQVMGALEASGQQFDAIWFLSADDDNWPLRGRPHPLLPNNVQRHFRMPHADADSDLDLARAVTARIAASAPVVVFSHAERNKDGELRPSALLPANAEWQRVSPLPSDIDHCAERLDEIEDASGSIAWPADRVAGGADILKKQAACPFQAFATKRLRAEELNRSDWGLSAAERGILLHRILEKIWSPTEGALHSLDDLRSAIDEGRLTDILKAAIEGAFSRFGDLEDAWMRAYLSSEKRRLLLRLAEWMHEEASRVPFRVTACEEKLDGINVGGLKLRLRADRIDQVNGSDRLLIDYKSGEVSPKDWQPPRPNEPQLPLYAVFGKVDHVRGVLFARIRAGKTGFIGSVADVRQQLFANAKSNSAFAKEPYGESVRDEWENGLLVLADEFLRGEAAVDPKEGKKTCEYCSLPGLCRVAETPNAGEEGAEAEGNGSDE
jgi:ATP-dependent helicase/nuclease subunit B